jgi:hypothetical protein
MDFVVHPRDRVLVAATHGRGEWNVFSELIEELITIGSAPIGFSYDWETDIRFCNCLWHRGNVQSE